MSSNDFEDEVASFERETQTHEDRKVFLRDGGPDRAKALLAKLNALRTRVQRFI